jgi:membrane-associated phospholipid phosphatase
MHFKKIFIFLFIILCFSFYGNGQNVDINILQPINQSETTFKNNFFKVTAETVTVFNIVAPVSLLTAGIVKHDKQLQKNAAYMVGGFVVSSIVTQSMKRIFKRDRPYVTYPYIINRYVGSSSYSFPSGHTSSAFCTATSLSLLFPKWYVTVPSYLYAATVGYARMYQGVHYPSDVIAGALVGAGSAWLCYKAEKWMDIKHKQNKKPASNLL